MSATRPNRWTGQIARVRGRDRRLDPLGVDEVGVRLDVDEDRRRAGVEDRVRRRGERVRDGDDLVARPEPEAGEDRHQGERPVADGDRVADAAELGPRAPRARRPCGPGRCIPLRRTSVTASISSWPRSGRAIGIMRVLPAGDAGAPRAPRRPVRRRRSARSSGSGARGGSRNGAGWRRPGRRRRSRRRTPQAHTQPMPPRRVAGDEGVGGHVAGDDRAGPDRRELADVAPATTTAPAPMERAVGGAGSG